MGCRWWRVCFNKIAPARSGVELFLCCTGGFYIRPLTHHRYRYFTPKMATPKITSTTPVARLRVAGSALLANLAAMRAHNRSAEHTAYQAEQVRRTANGKVADRTRQGRKGHDKHAGAHGGLQLIAPAPR